jgi:hypothetical protein
MAANFSNSTPTAPAGYTNGTWQFDLSGNISVYVPSSILTNQNTSLVSLLPGDVLVWNGSEWINSSFPIPAGAPGDIQYNDGGALGGSSATIDAAGNIIDRTGTLVIGNISVLPAYQQSLLYTAQNSINQIIPAGGSRNNIGSIFQFGGYCPDLNTGMIGMSGSVASPSPYGCFGLYKQAIITSNSNFGAASGFSADSYAQDSTVANGTLIGGQFSSWNNGGSIIFAEGLSVEVGGNVPGFGTGPTGILYSVGFELVGIASDVSSGTSIGFWIDYDSGTSSGIYGLNRYALKFDTDAQSAFNGVIGWQNTGLTAIDAGLSKLATNSVALGNGAQGDASGSLSLTNTLMQPIAPPTSALTAGTKGQIVFGTDGNLYVCTATGTATHATWTKATLTSV